MTGETPNDASERLFAMIDKAPTKAPVIMMSQRQLDDIKNWTEQMDVTKATGIGLDRGKQLAAHIVNDGRVDDDDKSYCGCPLGVDDIFCHTCMRSAVFDVEANGRQDADFTNNVAAAFNRESDDPTQDLSVLWDAFEEGLAQGIDEVLEKMVPADRLMTMVMRAIELDGKKPSG